jgi:hypothetical protein
MRPRAVASIAIATLLAVALVSAAAFAQDDGERVLAFVERATTDVVIDLGEDGDSLGDMIVFGNQLFDETDTTGVGRTQGHCVRTVPRIAWECAWTAYLEDGTIAVQGPFYDDLRDVDLAVTGGTGAYSGVRGELRSRSLDDTGTLFELVYRLRDDDDDDALPTGATFDDDDDPLDGTGDAMGLAPGAADDTAEVATTGDDTGTRGLMTGAPAAASPGSAPDDSRDTRDTRDTGDTRDTSDTGASG